ncbi:MAG: carbohydrate ABC transporter permease [Lachnospiraceae bacterium]|nr:carbohydrate ABC transporter permease [Lachnospiraceae bacterium]
MAYKGHRVNPDRFDKSQLKLIIAVLPIVLLTGLPILFIFCHALKPIDELFAFPPQFWVNKPTFENFDKLMKVSRTSGIPMSRYVFNSVIITGSVVFFGVVFMTMAAFALSKLRFKGKNTMLNINQAALMFVPVAVTIPRYLTVNFLGVTDTFFAHILTMLPIPVVLFLIKQFVDGVPDSLIEAAYIDGASEFKVYRTIVLPLSKPAIATGAIMIFQQVWGNMEASNYYISKESMKSLTFYMNTIANANNSVAGQGMQAAASLIMFVPNLVLFIILQGSIMNTMAHSGIK